MVNRLLHTSMSRNMDGPGLMRWSMALWLSLALLPAMATGPFPSIEAYTWDDTLLHPYSREAVAQGVKLPYTKSREECYNAKRNSTIVITLLLQHTPGDVPVVSSGSLARLVESTPGDVVMFHTGWSEQDIEAHVRSKLKIPVQVLCIANLDWQTGHRVQSWEFVETRYQSPGYRSMCRWYNRRLFNVMHSLGYQWLIRLDSDSQIPSPVPYNAVEQMLQRKAQYGFRTLDLDQAPVVYALAEAARYWIVAQKLNASNMWLLDMFKVKSLDGMSSENYDNRVIYNNFFVTNITFWMQPHVQGWLKHLEMLKGFHKFRWGDAATHLFTTGIFIVREQMLEFDFDYGHWVHKYAAGTYGKDTANHPKLEWDYKATGEPADAG